MTLPRAQQISLDATPYYHCVSRCVRRAFLCGIDRTSGSSYEHRRQWVEDKILHLAEIFALDICAFAVMSNHYHIVFHINKDKADRWSNEEVISRWHRLYRGNLLSQKYIAEKTLSKAENCLLEEIVANWRVRLHSISQFMQVLNESIAREANREDGCSGRFWEGRYKSQALLDDAALAACMAYVDLNPIRAQLAVTPEQSEHTSVKRRIERAGRARLPNHTRQQPLQLMPFAGHPRQDAPFGLPFRLTDYLQLIDWTGRVIRDEKRGVIPSDTPAIVERLRIEPKHWLYCSTQFESRFKNLVGRLRALQRACIPLQRERISGSSACQMLFG
ncbi:transposase [Pseudomaricurvus alcaniphilus]|uniref:transposase n=1 Tax=Pseudomaricurvus alcaniphilus TaxID=1166482 RepID=UPI00140C2014|nr:transposase [Pseudomaricurvus alcaniphilus]NHN38314.1 transposase [Pseudomaricurvus alcaniphilus]